MITHYTNKKNTLILSIMQARTDLETDMAFDIIKESDPSGERTIGVLTKVDLMNKDNDVCKYLQNNISKDLKLKYGYFAIKNRSPKEQAKGISKILNDRRREKGF